MTGRRYLYPQLWEGCVGAWCPSYQRWPSITLFDLSTNKNDGTLTSMDAATDWIPTGGKMALDFDGSDYVTMPSPAQASQVGVSMWVKYLLSANFDDCISAADSSIGSNGQWSIGTGFGATLGFNIRVPTTGLVTVSDSAAVVVGEWMHLVGTYDGANVEFWRNGVRQASSALNAATVNTLGTVMIGTRTAAGNFFTGQADDVRIYNRNLTPNDIRLLSQRRGIAFETAGVRRRNGAAAAPASSTSGNLLLLGVG